MLSCKDVSYLASKTIDTPLTRRERWGLWLHLLFCKLCRRYVRSLQLLQRALKQARKDGTEHLAPRVKMSDQARHRIRKALNDSNQE